ncbi:MAG: DNA-directed RNA polymerase subunit alpha [Candidatus Sungbacteria bacterium]|nr:DNA-directed RNA polymerase subunit alpha [Candidatus Sungbacteria bacterium]
MISLPIKVHSTAQGAHRAVFELEGLYPGYGQTIGNSLRRVLLSSLEGAVITSVKIDGVGHEFSTIEGVMEDVIDIILNLKQVRFRVHESGPHLITLAVKGEREVTAADFDAPSQVEVVTEMAPIATLTAKKSVLHIEATVEAGLGYVPVEARTKEKVAVGTIALDAAFSPVRHAHYEVENMRVADRTDYNRLRLTLETDGSLTPAEAFDRAVEILINQFSALQSLSASDTSADRTDNAVGTGSRGEYAAPETEGISKMKLDDLKISSRTLNALREAGIKTIAGLVRRNEESLDEVEGIGEKGIQEIKKALAGVGMTLK